MSAPMVPVDESGRCFYCRVWLCAKCLGCTHEHVRLPNRPDPETGGER